MKGSESRKFGQPAKPVKPVKPVLFVVCLVFASKTFLIFLHLKILVFSCWWHKGSDVATGSILGYGLKLINCMLLSKKKVDSRKKLG